MPVLTSKTGNTIASLFIFFMIIFSFKIFAEDPIVKRNPVPASDSCTLYLSDRPQNSVSNLDIFVNILYWHATETVDWASIHDIGNPNMQKHTFKDPTFSWDPGFRVGVGYCMEYDAWDTQFGYTRFCTRTSDSIPQGVGIIKPSFWGFTTALTESFLSGQLHWNIKFNMFDWDLGRSFWLGQHLAMRSFIGLKGGLIDQTIYTNWQNPTIDVSFLGTTLTATENLQQNFRGIGPKGGVNGKWVLGSLKKCRFSLIGDFAAAFLWGHWKFHDHFEDNLFVQVHTKVANVNFGALMTQAFLGLGFDFNFRKELSHFSFKMGYEIQDWFNAYQLFDDNTGQHNNDLILQGLTLDFRLDY